MIDLKSFLEQLLGMDEMEDDERVCLTRPQPGSTSPDLNYPGTPRRIAKIMASEPAPWYYCVSTVTAAGEDGVFNRKSKRLRYAMVVVCDDVGTKAKEPPIEGTYKLWSSEGNAHWGYAIEPFDVSTPEGADHYDACIRALAEAGYTDPGARGAYRVMRVPGSLHSSGFVAEVFDWHPERVWTLDSLMDAFGLEPLARRTRRNANVPGELELDEVDDVVLDWLRETGRVTGEVNDSFVKIICPWAEEHTAGDDTAGYSPLGYGDLHEPGFHCFHGHCESRSVSDLVAVMEQEMQGNNSGADSDPEVVAEAVAFPRLRARGLPDVRMTTKGPAARQLMTRPNLEWLLREWGLRVRYDVMRDAIEVDGAPTGTHRFEQTRSAVVDELTRLGVTAVTRVDELLLAIAVDDKYHPVEEWMQGLEWDGGDHIAALAATIETDSTLWPVYLRKWLIECVHGVSMWRPDVPLRPLKYALVFTGAQDIGKSTWFSKLAPDVPDSFLGDASLHLDKGTAKDDQINVLGHPIVELGELDSSFARSHIGTLKNFISRTVDKIRAPYGRVAIKRRRGTVFCGTVNEPEFLLDDTGSSRFQVVEVSGIEWDADIDIHGVWAQAYALWAAGESFELSVEDKARQAEENEAFEAPRLTTELISSFFDEKRMARPKSEWLPLGVIEIAVVSGAKDAAGRHPAAMRDAGNAVRRLFGKPRKIWGLKRRFLVPVTAEELRMHGLKVPLNSAVISA